MKNEGKAFYYGISIFYMLLYLLFILINDLKMEGVNSKLYSYFLIYFVGVIVLQIIFLLVEKLTVEGISLISSYYYMPYIIVLFSIIGVVLSSIGMTDDDVNTSQDRGQKYRTALYSMMSITIGLALIYMIINIYKIRI